MSQNEKQRVALVTGSSRGIGQAIAKRLAEEGLFVIGTATSEQGAQYITTYLSENRLLGRGVALDVTDANAVEALMTQLAHDKLMPDVLVNNAGITSDNLFLRMEDEEWYKVIETNLNAVYRLSKFSV